jgi:release factor glutamine methyltransferase
MLKTDKKNGEDMPEEYRQGYADFLGCRIDLSRKVLIPRPEPEFWTDLAIKDLQGIGKKQPRILDIFSGSGCIGVAVAKHIPGAVVDFADCDPEAVEQIKINLLKNSIELKRACVIQSNIFERILDSALYDAILANPPYVDPRRIGEVQPSVLEYEPRIALFGGHDGLEIIYLFLEQAKKFLHSEGFIYLEFDPQQLEPVKNKIADLGYSSYKFHKDQFNRWRFVKIIK